MLGMSEIAIIGLVLIFLFGSGKAVEWAKTLGTMKKEFDTNAKV